VESAAGGEHQGIVTIKQPRPLGKPTRMRDE
jgi:hypothetical protein